MGPREVVEHVFPGITESGDLAFVHRTDYDAGRFLTWVIGRMDPETREVKAWSCMVMDTTIGRINLPDDPCYDEADAVRTVLDIVADVKREDRP